MTPVESRIQQAPQTLKDLLAKPFPLQHDPPNDTYAWGDYCAFLANSPRRLIEIISADYHDTDEDEASPDETWQDYRSSYNRILEEAVSAVAAVFGPGQRLHKPSLTQLKSDWGRGKKLGSQTGTDHLHFDDDLFEFDEAEIVYWQLEGRVALIHSAHAWGDGDFQMSVCACVVPGSLDAP